MMQSYNGQKYSTYILELIRNNGITNMDGAGSDRTKADKKVPFSFLMFDYFDVLRCEELCGDEKKYLNYLTIENAFEDANQHTRNYRVSYKTLSLYCKSNSEYIGSDDGNPNIFSITNKGENLSDTPFLGLIQISLCKDNYIGKNIEEIGIDGFLESCESRIMEIAKEHRISESKTRMKLFRSSTTGDFCLVLRTDSVEEIYEIAIALNDTQNKPEEKVKMLTFTNVGIECKYLVGKGFATLDKSFVAKHSKIVIALRFCADASVQNYLARRKNAKIETIKGLFGRYEYLLNIGLDEFSDLYPFLCEQKLGKSSPRADKSELENIFEKMHVRNINERILIGSDTEISGGTEDCAKADDFGNRYDRLGDQEEKNEVFEQNEELFERIKKLEDRKNIFQEEHFAFQDLIRGMKEIYKAFSSAGMDKESYINWRIFHKDMNILCGCIKEMLDYYEKWKCDNKEDKKWYRSTVLADWRKNLQAINRFTTLVQNVNYQTYQAPIYEIQTQIDTEKAMVAYREAMTLYITDGFRELVKKDDKDEERVLPIIYPDLSKDSVEVAAPFIVRKPDGVMSEREIICTVPSFEYFGRLYDLLPWIIHETSHHLRVNERDVRNRFVTKYIFSYIFKLILKEPLRKLANCDFYENSGIVENYLAASMAEIAQEEMFNQKEFDSYNFERLILEIENWLKEMFKLGAGYDGRLYTGIESELKKKTFGFWLDAYRKEEILSDSNLNKILRIWDENNLEEKQELAGSLLDKYYENLCKELKDSRIEYKICLDDLKDYEHLKRKLSDCAKVSDENKEIVREYCYQVIAVYRIMKIDPENGEREDSDKHLKEYLKKVFYHYQNHYLEKMKENNMLTDMVVMHITRSLGLMNDNLELFQKEMEEIVRNTDNSVVMRHKDIKQRTYLETYADVLMAASLQLTGFGYCRQVLQIVSDAKLFEREYGYEDINYERWRIVAAVLLDKEKNGDHTLEEDGKKKVCAKDLIEDGKKYCKYTFKCILEKLSKLDDIKNDEGKQTLLKEFLGKMYVQTEKYLDKRFSESEEGLLLNALLQGVDKNFSEKVRKVWNDYKEVIKYCDSVKYNFWRIYCFCKGIDNIVQDGYIIVSKDIFKHMKDIYGKVKDDSCSKRGCYWEKDHDFLTEPKRDVGEFYNTPEQVYVKTPDQKLENTIDFIQNYYYYNRFRVMKEVADSSV